MRFISFVVVSFTLLKVGAAQISLAPGDDIIFQKFKASVFIPDEKNNFYDPQIEAREVYQRNGI